MNDQTYYVYMVSNYHRTVLYTGVTNNLEKRVYQHKNKLFNGFSKKYNCTDLVYFEATSDASSAIAREKQIKGWKRIKKDRLIKQNNPQLHDLSAHWHRLGPS